MVDVLASGDGDGCRLLLTALAASQGGNTVVLAFGRTRTGNHCDLALGVFPYSVQVCGVDMHGNSDVVADFNDRDALKTAITQLGPVKIIGAFFDWSTTNFIGVDGHRADSLEDVKRGHMEMFTCVSELIVPGGFLLYGFKFSNPVSKATNLSVGLPTPHFRTLPSATTCHTRFSGTTYVHML